MRKMVKIVIIILIYMIVGKGYVSTTVSAATNTEKGLNWEKLSQKYQANDLRDISYNEDNIYIAVGEEGLIIRSNDKTNWKEITVNTTKDFNTVTTNGKEFVAAGSGGIILYSTNGTKWKKATLSFPKNLTYKDIYKEDTSYLDKNYTINWNKKPKQSQLELKSILWDGKQYVGVGIWEITGAKKKASYGSSSGILIRRNFIVTSKNGKDWDVSQIHMEDVNKIIYTGKKYVVVSNKEVAFSSNLKKWNVTAPKMRGNITDIIYANGTYTVICWDGSLSAIAGTIHTSTDGIKWKEIFNKEQIGSASYEVDDTIKLYKKANGFSNLDMRSILWDGTQYVITGYQGMILTSKTGSNWKKMNERWGVAQSPFAYVDQSGARANIQKIIFDGEHYILVGNKGTVLVSENLSKGVVARARPSADYINIVYDGKSLYFAYGLEGDLLESNDGFTWRQVYIEGASPYLNWEGLAAQNGTAIAVCQGNNTDNAYYYYRDKAGIWTKMQFPEEVQIVRNVIAAQGKYYVSAKDGLITSKDGKTWSTYSLTKNPLRNFTYNGKVYVGQKSFITRPISHNALYTSTDFKKWTKVSVEKNKKKYYLSAENVVWNGNYFVTIGGVIRDKDPNVGEEVVGFSKDGIKWEIKESKHHFEGGIYGNKTYVSYDYAGDIYTSKNGIDYVKNEKPTKQRIQAVLWDGEKFLVAGDMGVILASVKENVTIPESENWEETKEEYSLTY